MAANQHAAHDLTCSICVDIFRDPVTLQCGHSYCRECLQMFADKSKPTAKDSHPCYSTGVISCPLCRSSVSLGNKCVASLTVDQELFKAVRKYQTGVTIPCCSMCEGSKVSEAVKYCSTCSGLYCRACLSALHPMRGHLKEHILLSIEDYLSTDTEPGASKTEAPKGQPACPYHNKSFSEFCFSCQQLLCNICLSKHSDHQVKDIRSAYVRKQKELGSKISEFKETRLKLMLCDSNIADLTTEIQDKETFHIREMEKVIIATQKALDKWRLNFTQAVKQQHRDWRVACGVARNDLKIHTDNIRDTLSKLSTAQAIEFLQDSTGVMSMKNINKQLCAAKDSLAVQENLARTNREALQLDFSGPKRICLLELFKGRPLSTPVLEFVKPSCAVLSQGNCRVNKGSSGLPYPEIVATNGNFRSGRHYWELDICVNERPVTGPSQSINVGLIRPKQSRFESGQVSLGVNIEYQSHSYKCYSLVNPDLRYQGRVDRSKPHRIGFCLDCEETTLVIVDCHNNQVMFSSGGVKDTAVTPGVSLENNVDIPVCIVRCDSATIPQVLREMLEK